MELNYCKDSLANTLRQKNRLVEKIKQFEAALIGKDNKMKILQEDKNAMERR